MKSVDTFTVLRIGGRLFVDDKYDLRLYHKHEQNLLRVYSDKVFTGLLRITATTSPYSGRIRYAMQQL